MVTQEDSLASFYCYLHTGNNFTQVYLSVQATTLELLKPGTSFLACGYILTIFRSSFSIKVIGQGRMYFLSHFTKIVNFMCFYSAQTCINVKAI